MKISTSHPIDACKCVPNPCMMTTCPRIVRFQWNSIKCVVYTLHTRHTFFSPPGLIFLLHSINEWCAILPRIYFPTRKCIESVVFFWRRRQQHNNQMLLHAIFSTACMCILNKKTAGTLNVAMYRVSERTRANHLMQKSEFRKGKVWWQMFDRQFFNAFRCNGFHCILVNDLASKRWARSRH